MSKVDKIALIVGVVLVAVVLIVPASRDYVWELVQWVIGLVMLGLMVIFNLIFG